MEPVEHRAMQSIVHRLHRRLPDVPLTRLEEEVGAAYAQYRGSRVRDFVWILVERDVLERRREARYAGRMEAGVPAHRLDRDHRPLSDAAAAGEDATAMIRGLHDVGFGGTGDQAGRS